MQEKNDMNEKKSFTIAVAFAFDPGRTPSNTKLTAVW
jgi:hypothetical protein